MPILKNEKFEKKMQNMAKIIIGKCDDIFFLTCGMALQLHNGNGVTREMINFAISQFPMIYCCLGQSWFLRFHRNPVTSIGTGREANGELRTRNPKHGQGINHHFFISITWYDNIIRWKLWVGVGIPVFQNAFPLGNIMWYFLELNEV